MAIISLITILNIMNSISMGVSARMKQYGAMRAVGMESRQVTKMIAAEAVTYAVCGTIAGIILVLLMVSFSCVMAVYAPAKRIRSMAITATINEV